MRLLYTIIGCIFLLAADQKNTHLAKSLMCISILTSIVMLGINHLPIP